MSKRRRMNEKQLDPKILKKRSLSKVLNNNETDNGSNVGLTNSFMKSHGKTLTLRSVWLVSCGLRIAWTLLGQTGYIHPDEFFQGPEIVSGNVFSFKVTKTWEFTSEPIRSMLPPAITVGIPYLFLQSLSKFPVVEFYGIDLISAHSLVCIPRLTYCLLSFIIDFCLRRISSLCKLPTYSVLTAFSTSYIVLVFYTRTLSNTLEAIFFSSLLYVVIATRIKNASPDAPNRDMNRSPSSSSSSSSSSSPPLLSSPSSGSFRLSLLLVGGFFNRPTFLAFGFVPFLFWLFDSCSPLHHRLSRRYILLRLVSLVPGCCLATGVFVIFDSAYYGSLTLETVVEFLRDPLNVKDLSQLAFVVAPVNFIRYNLDSSNLSSHGRHPFYTHLFNSFLLYGVIAVSFFVSIYHKLYAPTTSSSSSHLSQSNLLTYSYLFPLAFLSLFAHQEPRFLIPLLAPLCLLHSDLLFGARASRLLAFTWFFWGVAGAVLFGILHQGGVVPSLAFLSRRLGDASFGCPTKIVYYQTYMPPQHLLAIPKEITNGSRCDDVRLVDLKGCSVHVLMNALREAKKERGFAEDGAGDVVFAAPASVIRRTLCHRGVKFALLKTFFPHLSMETPPRFVDLVPPALRFEEDGSHDLGCRELENLREKTLWERLQIAFSLAVVKIDMSTLN